MKLKSDLIFQNGISSWGGTRKLPYAFTEQGLAMLSGILHSDIVLHDQNDINESTRMQLENITLALSELQAKDPRQKPRRRIGFIQDEE